jgi:hypothetical protein
MVRDEEEKPTKNNHPTVKPIKLMEYLKIERECLLLDF